MNESKILILDFGGQATHLIGRRVRELGYAAEIVPPGHSAAKIKRDPAVRGLILSGGARSVYEKNAPRVDTRIFSLGLPVLGICYGHQVVAHSLGGKVEKGAKGEYGPAAVSISKKSLIFNGVVQRRVWMNHRDTVVCLPRGFRIVGKTTITPIAAMENRTKKIFAVQFHPEVTHTPDGRKILKNFLDMAAPHSRQAGLNLKSFVREARGVIGNQKALVALSGGVDSAVAAILVAKAIGKNLYAVYVDTGLMRKGETKAIQKIFQRFPFRFSVVRAAPRFLRVLRGVTDPEEKRKRIGRLFIRIFEEEAKKRRINFLVQGTIYPDRIESGSTKHSSNIKSHHNVGGLPPNLRIRIYEPLRELYKDEVREVARMVGLPKEIAERKPFPGPGLAIRIVGEVTAEKIRIVQEVGAIIEEEFRKTSLFRKIWMAFPVLLSIQSVGIEGDTRSYKYPIVLRVIESKDVMSANFSKIPYPVLEKISSRITNEIKEVNRVVYDVTNKPPATMEWE